MKKSELTKPRQPRRVAVLVDTSTDWGRRIISGIVRYVREHETWHLFVEPSGIEGANALPKGWHGDGVIARVNTAQLAKHLRAACLPVVNVSGIQTGGPQFPRVANDVRLVAEMAADYLLERGFRNFGYVSPIGLQPVAQQRSAFVEAVTAAGGNCVVYSVKTHHSAQVLDWNINMNRIGGWLRSLPKPVALLTWSGGHEIINACRAIGLGIPEEVAVLSGSDDFLCEMSQVPISGVRAAAERIGYEAATRLDLLMHGEAAQETSIYVPPIGVVTRQSTDTLAIHDQALIQALTFMRQNAEKSIKVREAAQHAGISRRVLERRFKEILGSTPAEHIRRSHLERAKRLLTDTNLPMPEVAGTSGFGSSAYMSYIFQKELGTTPLKYRREARGARL